MSKRRDESESRPGDRKAGFGRPESTNKFYSKFNKDADRRDGDSGFERRERSFDKPGYDKPGFDKPRGSRPSGGGRRFESDRSERPRRDDLDRLDRPRFGQSDDRRSFNRDENRGRNDRFRDDSPRGGRYEGGGPRRNFDETRPNRRDDERGFGRRDDRFDRNESRNDRFESGGPRREARRDDDRFDRDRNNPRSNRFGGSDSRDERPRYGRSGEAGGRNNDRFGNEKSYGDRNRYSDERSERPERRDDRFGNERGYSDRSDRNREGGFRARRDDRPDNRERRSFDRDRRNEQPERFERSNYERPGREDVDPERQRKIEASRERQVGRSRAPEYDLDKLKERALGGRSPRDKKGGKKPGRGQAGADRSERTPREAEDGMIRLNRYIANAGICSRRDADELIAQGDISVNGKVITEMGYRVKPTDVVKYGTRVLNPEKMTYVLLNKPKDYITTTDDPNDRNTVMDLVAGATPYRIYPVGRLDRNTTGLLLLTNDGELVEKLTHPSNEIKKVYQVELDKPITNEHFEAIRDGIELEDGPIKPDDLGIVTPDAQVVGIEIHSGRNRIVRRIFEHFGYEVTKLDRTVYAGLTKKDLPRGTWRYLDEKEVIRLKFLL
ncbi:pseudouridine synthase [Larkinella sp. VNQ87]|uniref:pseudouridine synthase n=1 Tax=Larkinella sp. VNQ87 TaxID=3400921 RepID=UPI003C0D85DC